MFTLHNKFGAILHEGFHRPRSVDTSTECKYTQGGIVYPGEKHNFKMWISPLSLFQLQKICFSPTNEAMGILFLISAETWQMATYLKL